MSGLTIAFLFGILVGRLIRPRAHKHNWVFDNRNALCVDCAELRPLVPKVSP